MMLRGCSPSFRLRCIPAVTPSWSCACVRVRAGHRAIPWSRQSEIWRRQEPPRKVREESDLLVHKIEIYQACGALIIIPELEKMFSVCESGDGRIVVLCIFAFAVEIARRQAHKQYWEIPIFKFIHRTGLQGLAVGHPQNPHVSFSGGRVARLVRTGLPFLAAKMLD